VLNQKRFEVALLQPLDSIKAIGIKNREFARMAVITVSGDTPGIIGGGVGDDRYVLNPFLIQPNQQITLSDTLGSNIIQLDGDLEISSSSVTSTAMLLTLSNGAEVTILGADTLQFLTGGDGTTGQGGITQTFANFVTNGLGIAQVPASGAPMVTGGPVTVNETGGTNGGGTGGGQSTLPTVSLAPTNGQTTEGDRGNTIVTFTATLSSASSQQVSVDYATSSSSAHSGVDFLAASGSLVFAPGTTQRTFDVEVVGDTEYEPDEILRVELSNPQGAALDQSGSVIKGFEALHTISDDDNPNDFSQTLNSHFLNSFTFTISGNSAFYSEFFELITLNAVEVIEYLSDFISWNGVLNFVVSFDGPINFGPNGIFTYSAGDGLLPAYGGIAANGQTFAQQESLTGIDENGSDYDLGAYILPNVNGSLTNYGFPLFFDDNPNAYSQQEIPPGHHDFFSIFLHEVLHGMGFWSTAQHDGFGNSAFDDFTVLRNGQYYFEGDAVLDLLGEGLPLATTGSRDHYGFNINGPSPMERGTVFESGNYEQNRWHLGQVELAVLSDMGYLTANEDLLPIVEQPDQTFAFLFSTDRNTSPTYFYDFF
jgi:hypothetical protein